MLPDVTRPLPAGWKIYDKGRGFCLVGERAYRGMTLQEWLKVRELGHVPLSPQYMAGGVYSYRLHFTSDPALADFYGRYWAGINKEKKYVVISFFTPEKTFEDEGGVTAGAECGGKWRTEYYTTETIPVEQVSVVKTGRV